MRSLKLTIEQLQTICRKLNETLLKTELKQFLLKLRDYDRDSREIKEVLCRVKALQEPLTIRIPIITFRNMLLMRFLLDYGVDAFKFILQGHCQSLPYS